MRARSRLRSLDLRRRFSVPRELYVAAVRRHEARILALHGERWTWRISMELRMGFWQDHGIDWPQEPPPRVELFDRAEDVARDDALIGFHLEDDPGAVPQPLARGRTLEELWLDYKRTEDFAAWQAWLIQHMSRRAEQIAAELMAEDGEGQDHGVAPE